LAEAVRRPGLLEAAARAAVLPGRAFAEDADEQVDVAQDFGEDQGREAEFSGAHMSSGWTSPWNTSGVRALNPAAFWNTRRRINSRAAGRSSAISRPRAARRSPAVVSSTNVTIAMPTTVRGTTDNHPGARVEHVQKEV
jgi:hypothetical protein